MVGQKKLLDKFNSYSLTTLPHSILLVGDGGCGKHTLIKEFASKFEVEVVDISSNISLELIEEISNVVVPTIYIIDSSKITEKNQNALLKFLEEPSMYAYIFILTTSKSILLNTIINRCVVFEFAPYTKEELKTFLGKEDESILDICTTPGQVQSLHITKLGELKQLCNTIITKIGKANYSNTLSIVKKINLKDEYDKFDINVFFNTLLNEILSAYSNSQDVKLFEMYNLVLSSKKKLRDSRLNKELFMENFLTSMWEFTRQ